MTESLFRFEVFIHVSAADKAGAENDVEERLAQAFGEQAAVVRVDEIGVVPDRRGER